MAGGVWVCVWVFVWVFLQLYMRPIIMQDCRRKGQEGGEGQKEKLLNSLKSTLDRVQKVSKSLSAGIQ